jgi:O-methyltransferase
MICDDYGSEACPGAKRAMDEVAAVFGVRIAHLTTGQGLIIKNS